MPTRPLSLVLDNKKVSDLENRQSIFLDSNIWIDLADNQSLESRQAKLLLLELVLKGAVFCPVSITSLFELFLQEYDSAIREAELMDTLSLNVTFRHRDEIMNEEISAFVMSLSNDAIVVPQANLNYSQLFAPAAAFIGSRMNLAYPENASSDFVDDASLKLENKMKGLGVAGLVNLFKAHLPMRDWKNDFSTEMYSEIFKERREISKGNRKEAREIEKYSVLRSELVPNLINYVAQLDPLPSSRARNLIEAYVFSLEEKAGEILLKKIPSLRRYAEVLTITALDDSLKMSPNHMMDVENMIIPPIYSNVFVARDRWVKAMMSDMTMQSTNKAQCLFSIKELISYCDNLKG